MSRKAQLQVPPLPVAPAKADEARLALEGILSSPLFRASRRCQNLLRRIVEETLLGSIDCLKERTLGVDVFGRPADYDTSQDPVVRATAAEIRKKLAQYYQEAGHEAEVRIELPPGSYIAEFRFNEPVKPAVPVVPARPWRTIVTAGAIAAAGLSMLAVTLTALTPKRSDLDELWEPVVKSPGSVLVAVGLQAAYNLRSAQAQDALQGITSRSSAGQLAQAKSPEGDLVLLRNRYVALDDALCLVRVTSLLDRFRKPYRIRAEQSMSFADLRDTPAVLIGAFDNPWTLLAASSLRFTFRKDSEHDTGMVFDRQHPENTAWKLMNYWPDWNVPSDYAVVTRMRDVNADRPVVIAAGLTQYGTIGAGEFLTNPQYFSEASRQFPRGWQKKNLQIVLRVPVVDGISGRPQILASYFW